MNKRILIGLLLAVAGCLAVLAASTHPSRAQDRPSRVSIQGTVVGIGGRYSGRTRPFRLNIARYTSPEEVQQLNAAMQSGGQEELLRVLSRMNAGMIAVGNGVGVPANAIIRTPAEVGARIVVLYQRNVSFFELRAGARSADYRFGYAEIILDASGRGEGTFIPAAKVRLRDDGRWEVEDFGEFPARLMGMRLRS
ncbi:MAG TPA: hypothetical protein VGX92_10165 [Pyrinomonadaceae bacterium]|jgi:hypothetical protein|nr:hypothetical protein [Pyrinomonadaceae bacterium]